MQFNRIQQKSVIRAIVIGSLTGFIGVVLFIFALKQAPKVEEPVKVDSQVTEQVRELFYASQHGTFSTEQGAQNFVASYPTLNLATIFEIEGQFYIWSELSLENPWQKQTVVPSSFVKTIYVSASQCSGNKLQQIPANLKNSTLLTTSTLLGESAQQLADGWQKTVESIELLTKNEQIIRLHVLKSFEEQHDCLNISF